MDDMVVDMRNRFVVALVFALPITMYSHIGMDLLGLHLPIPFGLRPDVWQLLLSLPVVFYSSTIFFTMASPRPVPRALVVTYCPWTWL